MFKIVINAQFNEDIETLLNDVSYNYKNIKHGSFIFIDYYNLPKNINYEAKRSLEILNAGGQSEISEMFSINYFIEKYNASNIILEKEVIYWIDYKMVDFIVTIGENRIGVSVARAMGFPNASCFTYEMAKKLLFKKIYGLIVARNGVVKEQSFYRSFLHIWCQSENIANLLQLAFENLDENDYGLKIKGILLLQLTICDDQQIYSNFLI